MEDHLALLELDYPRDVDRARATVALYVDPIALTKVLMAAAGWDPARRMSADPDPRTLPPYLLDRPLSAAHTHAVRILEQFGGLVVVVPCDRSRNLSFMRQAPFVFGAEPAIIASDRDGYGTVLVDVDAMCRSASRQRSMRASATPISRLHSASSRPASCALLSHFRILCRKHTRVTPARCRLV